MTDGKLTRRIANTVPEGTPVVEIQVPPEYTRERLLKELEMVYIEKNEELSPSIDLKKHSDKNLYIHLLNMQKKSKLVPKRVESPLTKAFTSILGEPKIVDPLKRKRGRPCKIPQTV